MSNYGDPGPSHRNALNAVNEARQRALTAFSKMRQGGPPPHHRHLAPADGKNPEVATIATQAVVDYLMQLRPYRGHSATWDVRFGKLELPETLPGDAAGRSSAMGFGGNGRRLHICRHPTFHVENVSDFVEVANTTVQYSTARRRAPGASGGRPGGSTSAFKPWESGRNATRCNRWKVDTGEYGTIVFTDPDHVTAFLSGNLSIDEALEVGELADEEDTDDADDTEDDPLVLGDPTVTSTPGDTRGRDPEVKSYNLVFSADELQRFVHLGDDVAAEVDVLADLEAPDHSAGPGGAV